MPYLLDANILLRLADPASSQHELVSNALTELFAQGEELVVSAQAYAEFWAVATRPITANGLGYTPEYTYEFVNDFLGTYGFLPDRSDTFGFWHDLVKQYAVSGKPTHDAKLVALMQAHQLEQILTINTADFARYREIQAIHPNQILKGAA
jgi:predicted nucleic acid-binding protein